MTQPDLFTDPDRLVAKHELDSLRAQVAALQAELEQLRKPKCARTLTEADNKRLNKQCAAILARLKLSPATNDELSRISRKYTSRISDCRAAGHNIRCERLADGLTLYRLVEEVAP